MPVRPCDVMLFCGILLVFVRPSCKSIYRVYRTKQTNNKTPPRPVLEVYSFYLLWGNDEMALCDNAVHLFHACSSKDALNSEFERFWIALLFLV